MKSHKGQEDSEEKQKMHIKDDKWRIFQEEVEIDGMMRFENKK